MKTPRFTRACTVSLVTWGLASLGCGGTVVIADGTGGAGGAGGGGAGGEPCVGAACDPAQCPDFAPLGGEYCDLPEFSACRYPAAAIDCEDVWQCHTPSPDALATWVYAGQSGAGCGACAPPTCDPGDEEDLGCPLDAPCYDVTNMCGETTRCLDHLPEHGCPEDEPLAGTACEAGLYCTYETAPDCYASYACEAGAWSFFGGGCDGGL